MRPVPGVQPEYGLKLAGVSLPGSLLNHPRVQRIAGLLPIAMLSGHHRYILIAYKKQGRLLACTAASAATAVVLGLILVPRYDGPGAAWALLIANIVNFALVYISVKQLVIEVPVHKQLIAPSLALAAAGIAFLLMHERNFWVALGLACVMYIAAFAWVDGRRFASIIRAATNRYQQAAAA